MIFSSLVFLFAFLPLILTVYYGILQKQQHKNIFLLLSSLVFYAWGEPTYILLMIVSICLNFRFGLILDKVSDEFVKKQALFAGIFCNLFFLFIFKYETLFSVYLNNFLLTNFNLRITPLNLSLPIGISFFTFQAISYLVDVYRKNAEVQTSVLNLGLYISFFPQLIAGPIVRYSDVAKQIGYRKTSYLQFTNGVKLFIIGLGKKVILANQLALIADEVFIYPSSSIPLSWLGAICYSLQIYYDFSGYSDMAIGLGKMFGFNFPKNFNYPYISQNITEFWRRWHISLGSWFRDYVYIPLGGSRVNKFELVLNLFFIWILTGFWHGASFRFVIWGLLYFVVLTFEKLTNLPNRLKNWFLRLIYRIFTLIIIIIGWVIFRSTSLLFAFAYINSMFGNSSYNNHFVDNDFIRNINNSWVLILFAVIFATPILKNILMLINEKKCIIFNNFPTFYAYFSECISTLVYLIIFFVSISYLVIGSHNPFIYFNF